MPRERWIPVIVVLALLSVAPLLCACSGEMEDSVTVEQLREQRASGNGFVVLDVRTTEELTGPLGQLEGIVNIPVQELESRLQELDRYSDQRVYVICRSGNRSRTATRILRNAGFEAYNVTGGMRAWRSAFGETKN